VLRRAVAAKRAPDMATGATGEGRAKPRSGSEKRQRTHVARIRLDDAEQGKLEELASASGLSVGAYLRAAALKSAGVRAKPRPSVDRELLARANADLNRVGNNINQIAHALNSGRDPPFILAEAMADLRGALTAIRRAAGYDSQG
jgi:predicted transcriptional regulator